VSSTTSLYLNRRLFSQSFIPCLFPFLLSLSLYFIYFRPFLIPFPSFASFLPPFLMCFIVHFSFLLPPSLVHLSFCSATSYFFSFSISSAFINLFLSYSSFLFPSFLPSFLSSFFLSLYLSFFCFLNSYILFILSSVLSFHSLVRLLPSFLIFSPLLYYFFCCFVLTFSVFFIFSFISSIPFSPFISNLAFSLLLSPCPSPFSYLLFSLSIFVVC
jgi:hypothetical protein